MRVAAKFFSSVDSYLLLYDQVWHLAPIRVEHELSIRDSIAALSDDYAYLSLGIIFYGIPDICEELRYLSKYQPVAEHVNIGFCQRNVLEIVLANLLLHLFFLFSRLQMRLIYAFDLCICNRVVNGCRYFTRYLFFVHTQYHAFLDYLSSPDVIQTLLIYLLDFNPGLN